MSSRTKIAAIIFTLILFVIGFISSIVDGWTSQQKTIGIVFTLFMCAFIAALLYIGDSIQKLGKKKIESRNTEDKIKDSAVETTSLIAKYNQTLYTKEELTAFRKEGLKLSFVSKLSTGDYIFLFEKAGPNPNCECEVFHLDKPMSEEEIQKKTEEGWKCVFAMQEIGSDNVYSYFEKQT